MEQLKLILLILCIAVYLSACSSSRVKRISNDQQTEQQSRISESQNIPVSDNKAEPQEKVKDTENAELLKQKIEPIILVFGPGLARSFAYIGILRVFEERKIAVKAIFASEVGAVISTIWSSSNSNNLEWLMHKFRKETLLDIPLLNFNDKLAEGKELIKYLNEALPVEDLQKLRVPVWVGKSQIESQKDSIAVENSGPIIPALRAAVNIPGIMKKFTINGKRMISSIISNPLLVSYAKALNYGKVVCVDVLGSGINFDPNEYFEEYLYGLMKSLSTKASEELEMCDDKILISTDNIGFLDFNSKAELIYRGKTSAEKWIERRQ